jgi:predicted protein tyrosine phosphatase
MTYKGIGKLVIALVLISQNQAFSMARYAFHHDNSAICDATHNKPCLVRDTDKTSPVGSLRDALMINHAYEGNTAGVDNLHVSASSEPSEKGWQRVADYLAKKGVQPEHVIILDLRQESHGYLNGNAITLCDKHNWLNLEKTRDEVIGNERQWLYDLSLLDQVNNVLSHKQFTRLEYTLGKSIRVKSITSEKDLITKWNFNYLRIPVPDHRAPGDKEVDQFVSLMANLPDKVWLHIHCRGGKGRSTSFLAMYDMLKNADQVSFDDIIKRQASIPPYYNLSVVERDDPELSPYYQERYLFLSSFYQFARDRLLGYKGSWTAWKQANVGSVPKSNRSVSKHKTARPHKT